MVSAAHPHAHTGADASPRAAADANSGPHAAADANTDGSPSMTHAEIALYTLAYGVLVVRILIHEGAFKCGKK